MKKRYEQIMEKVEVTDEMRNRILNQIRNTDLGSLTSPPLQLENKRHFQYKKYLRMAACLAILLICAAAMPGLLGHRGTPGPTESQIQMVPDIQKHTSLEALSTAVGFPVMEPKNLPFEVEETVYLAFWQELAQIQYSGEGMTATFRMSAGTEDTSGDYNSYAAVAEYRIGRDDAGEDLVEAGISGAAAGEGTFEENIVTLKGNGGGYSLALWTDGRFFYSIKMSDEQSDEVFLNMISGMGEEK